MKLNRKSEGRMSTVFIGLFISLALMVWFATLVGETVTNFGKTNLNEFNDYTLIYNESIIPLSSDLTNRPEMSYVIDNDDLNSEYVIKKFLEKLKEDLNDKNLNEQEYKLGGAIYDLFENYGTIFPDTNNNKFNKNIILFELREMTNLSTKEIRSSIKKYKKMYFDLVQDLLKS